MKQLIILCAFIGLALGFPPVSNAQADVVDFGDSGIEVVVEADSKTNEPGWTYWFPDEFFSYFPPFPRLPTIPSFPGWGGGWGGGDDGDDSDCYDATNDLLQVYESILGLENSIKEYEKSGVMWVGDRKVTAGSEEFEDILRRLKDRLRQREKELNEARKKVEEAC